MAFYMKDDKEHYSAIPLIRTMLKHNANYGLSIGMRSNGKSFSIREFAIKMSLGIEPIRGEILLPPKSEGIIKPRFLYLRRWEEDLNAKGIKRYFSDVPYLQDITEGDNERAIEPYGSEIWLGHYEEAGNKKIFVRDSIIGYSASLNNAEHIKSQYFGDEMCIIIFEEFITNGLYIAGMGEPDELQQAVATIFRNKAPYHFIFLIGNTISQVNPYYRAWNLVNIPRQASDTRDIYTYEKLDGTTVNIVCEMARQRKLEEKTNKLFFGTSEGAITQGAWVSKEFPRLETPWDECKCLYKIIILLFGFQFVLCYMRGKSGFFLYVYPFTGQVKEKQRVITDEFHESPYYSYWFLDNQLEKKIAFLYNEKKICFSDNLTGANFSQIIENMR